MLTALPASRKLCAPRHQGNRLNVSCSPADNFLQVVLVPSGPLTAVLEVRSWFGLCQRVHCHVLDDCHVGGTMAGAQAGEIVTEHNIQYPVQTILDSPMAAYDTCKGFGVSLLEQR